MLKFVRGYCFLRNGETLPRGWRTFWKSHNKLSFMFLCIFHGLLKSNTWEFWLLFQLLITFTSIIDNVDKAGFSEYPNRYFIWVLQLVPNVFVLLKNKSVLHYVFKKNSHLIISLTYFNNFNKTDSEENEEILSWWGHKILCWKHMLSISWFANICSILLNI